jgi:hypothetical protein
MKLGKNTSLPHINWYGNCRAFHREPELCRDSKAETRNSLKPGATDGYLERPGTPWEPIIEPLSHPHPLSTRPLST